MTDTITFSKIEGDDVMKLIVYRNKVWLGTIEEWTELRYVHSPDRETFKSLRQEDLRAIVEKMTDIEGCLT